MGGSKTYGGVSYNENDISSWSANANFTSLDVCDFITFTENCVCAGVYSAQAWVDCVGTSDRVMKDDGAGGYVEDDTTSPLCAKHGGLDKYIDTRAISKKVPTNSVYDVSHIALICAVLMSFSRFVARLLFPCELKKPGAMWVNGWPAGLLCLITSMGLWTCTPNGSLTKESSTLRTVTTCLVITLIWFGRLYTLLLMQLFLVVGLVSGFLECWLLD